MSTFLLAVVTHTPLWVWGILALLVALGLKQSRDHVVSRGRVAVQPVGMALFSLISASSVFGLHANVQVAWLLGALLGYALNRLLMLPRQVEALPDGRFAIGGSWGPLALMMAIFGQRYVVGASLAIVPALANEPMVAAVASLFYGLPAGLLAARAQRVLAHAPAAPALQTA